MRVHLTVAAILASPLAGCSSAPLSQLQETALKGSAVSRALARAYTQFAAVEVTEMIDLKDGEYFAHKSLKATQGSEPAPEVVVDYAAPKVAASAQVGFDCRIEQQEEEFQPGGIEICRQAFAASVSALDHRKDLYFSK